MKRQCHKSLQRLVSCRGPNKIQLLEVLKCDEFSGKLADNGILLHNGRIRLKDFQ